MKIQDFKKVSKEIMLQTRSLNAVVKCVNSILNEEFELNGCKLTLSGWLNAAGVPLDKNGKLSVKDLLKFVTNKESGKVVMWVKRPITHRVSEFECKEYNIPLELKEDGTQVRPKYQVWYTEDDSIEDGKAKKLYHYRYMEIEQWSVYVLLQLLEQKCFATTWKKRILESQETIEHHKFNKTKMFIIEKSYKGRTIIDEFRLAVGKTFQRENGLDFENH